MEAAKQAEKDARGVLDKKQRRLATAEDTVRTKHAELAAAELSVKNKQAEVSAADEDAAGKRVDVIAAKEVVKATSKKVALLQEEYELKLKRNASPVSICICLHRRRSACHTSADCLLCCACSESWRCASE